MGEKNGKQAELLRAQGYIPVKEAADRLGTAASTIYRALDEKRLTEARVGRARYVLFSSLVAYAGSAAKALGLVPPDAKVEPKAAKS